MENLNEQNRSNETDASYSNIKEILSTSLPENEAALFEKFKRCYSEGFFESVISKKVEEIIADKYGDLYHDDFYYPNCGYYEDHDEFLFDFEDFSILVETADQRKGECFEDLFDDGGIVVRCILQMDDEDLSEDELSEADLPDYIKALVFDDFFPYECFEEALDTLFKEIARCKQRYLNEKSEYC